MPIRIGFVGIGWIAGTHMDALSQLEDAQPVAFCDLDSGRAERAAARFGGRAYTDWRAMLDAESLDALYICLPPHGHDGVEIEAAQRGIHLFIEKPVARDLDYARRVEEAIQKAGIICSVGYHFRYYGATERAKERLQGLPVLMVKGAWDGGMPTAPRGGAPMRTQAGNWWSRPPISSTSRATWWAKS
jgi:myo-inositol 2-dehydrogenase/D-chiro-inositol 1-dehydrogenase